MNIDKYTSSNGYVLASNHYRGDMAFLNELVKEVKKDFPFVKEEDINPFVVTKSSFNQGFSGIRFSLPANTKKKGYKNVARLGFQTN